LNSFITAEGGEIGRAQALQAEAARIEPHTDMNPVLLKAQGDSSSQVIMRGKVFRSMKATEYYSFRDSAWDTVKGSFDALAGRHDLIFIEGAGSPAEINLMDVDIVNMTMAEYASAPVLLVGDIDRGGVFASLYGTVQLLGSRSSRIKGFIINKFRGDKSILDPGLAMITEKTGIPVAGVVPYIAQTGLPEEDGLVLSQQAGYGRQSTEAGAVKVAVVKLQHISNFTDFDPLGHEPDVDLVYTLNPSEFESADLVILPGTKNTVKDLLRLRQQGIDKSIARAYAKGVQIIGICGGYQMLGRRISDHLHVESGHDETEGLGLLDIETDFNDTKTTCQVEARPVNAVFGISVYEPFRGYEIHMGRSSGDIGIFSKRLLTGGPETIEGSIRANCWGTYIHGIFDHDGFRRSVINGLRMAKGLPGIESGIRYSAVRDEAINRVAAILKENIDMELMMSLLRL
jgi:adenosylcobyric acid synthase